MEPGATLGISACQHCWTARQIADGTGPWWELQQSIEYDVILPLLKIPNPQEQLWPSGLTNTFGIRKGLVKCVTTMLDRVIPPCLAMACRCC